MEEQASNAEGLKWPVHRDLAEFHSLLMHPFLTAIVMECSASRVAHEGLKCSHAEIVIVPESYFDERSNSNAMTDIQATLETIQILLEHHGVMIVTGTQQLDAKHVINRIGLPGSRIQFFSSDEEAIASIRDSLKTSTDAAPYEPDSRELFSAQR